MLVSALTNQNGLVRKGAACVLKAPRKLHRITARPEEYLWSPPIFANSFPKSGTHLLFQIANGLPGKTYGSFLASMTSSFVFKERSLWGTRRFIDGFAPGEIVRGHLFFHLQYAVDLAAKHAVHLFIYRDPRAVVVAEAHYLSKMNRWHRLAPYFRARSKDEAITLSITGLPVKGIDYPNIVERFARYQGWLNRKDCLAIRFEDLMSDKRPDVLRDIATFYAQHSADAVDIDQCVHSMEAMIAPDKSHTYSGKVTGWRSEFTEEHHRIFDEIGRGLLQQIGY